MPSLEITDEQASFLDALRDAIEDQLVGPYGTVRRRDAMQYLIDNYGEPDELLADGSASDVIDDAAGGSEPTDAASDPEPAEDGEPAENADDTAESDDGGESAGGDAPSPSDGDAMLDEMMSLLEDNDEVWTEADSQETRYEVELPDGDFETVQTKDDVRALLFKHYR